MKLLWILLSLSMLSSSVFADAVIDGFKMPESVAQDKDGNIYVSEIGERDVDKDGKITMMIKVENASQSLMIYMTQKVWCCLIINYM